MSQFQNLKYLTIYREMQKKLQTGSFEPGDKLPTETVLAKQYGVSRPTVTRALNALKEEGLIYRITGSGSYVSNRNEHMGLALNRMVGLLIPNLGLGSIYEPICARIAEQSGAGHFSLLWGGGLLNANEISQPEDLIMIAKKYRDHKVSAVIFTPLDYRENSIEINKEILTILDNAGIPIILLDSDCTPFPFRSSYDLVSMDHYSGAYEMTEIFLNQRCKRIDFLYKPHSAASIKLRLHGYRSALFDRGITPDSSWIHEIQPKDKISVKHLIDKSKVTNLICGNDETAAELLQTLTSLGYRVPADIRLCGFDDVKYGQILIAALTTYHQPCHLIADETVRLLLSRLKNRDIAPRTVTVNGYSVIRESSQLPSDTY